MTSNEYLVPEIEPGASHDLTKASGVVGLKHTWDRIKRMDASAEICGEENVYR